MIKSFSRFRSGFERAILSHAAVPRYFCARREAARAACKEEGRGRQAQFPPMFVSMSIDKSESSGFFESMRETLRASKLLAHLFRLVMILSLAGYSVSTVNAAMHGPGTGGMQHDQSAMITDHGGPAMTPDNHGNHNMADNDHGDNKPSEPQCCGDFCLGMAVLIGHDSIGTPVVSSIRSFLDDSKALGQIPLLHRPPNI